MPEAGGFGLVVVVAPLLLDEVAVAGLGDGGSALRAGAFGLVVVVVVVLLDAEGRLPAGAAPGPFAALAGAFWPDRSDLWLGRSDLGLAGLEPALEALLLELRAEVLGDPGGVLSFARPVPVSSRKTSVQTMSFVLFIISPSS